MTLETRNPARLKQFLEEGIRAYVGADTEMGVSAALAVGDVRAFMTSGLADRETKRPVREDTLFIIGSVQKTFTDVLPPAPRSRGIGVRCAEQVPGTSGDRGPARGFSS